MDNYSKIKKVLIIVLAFNWTVAVLKIFFGYWIKSASMIADGYHSFSDGASNIIGLIGIGIASHPVDADHPYGHKKYETFTAIIIAIMLFIISFHIIHDNVARLRSPVYPNIDIYSFGVMLVTIIINIAVMLYEKRAGRRLNSDILVSDSLHTRSDVLTSFSVIAAFLGVKMGLPILDPVCSLIISLFIGYAGLKILFSSSKVLCDTALIDIKKIEEIVNSIDGVIECHNIRARGRQDDIYIDLHVLVKKDMRIDKADSLSDKIERTIKDNIGGVSDVIVHMEPKVANGRLRSK